jgi:hypothetical protein
VENITCENVEPALTERESVIEDHRPHEAEPFGQNHTQPAASIDNPQPAIENPRRRPYVKTPARLAAARANLEKARAAPKEKVYRRTDKRLAANRSNLAKAKAARQKELEAVVDRLDMAFPPLGEEISEEALEPDFMCTCGSGKTFEQCCKGRKPKTGIPEPYIPKGRQSDPEEEEEADVPEVPRIFFRFGSTKWVEEGVDREAPDYGALEKAGRALLHRQRALLNEVRREGQQVMRLLTQAAERTVAPTLQDLLALAGGLMAVLGNSRLGRRAQRLNRRVAKLLEAFVQKRYEKAGVVVSAEAMFERLMAEAVEGLPPLPQRQRRPRSPAVRSGAVQPKQPAKPSQSDRGPDLPGNNEEFVSLVRRAFCAPRPEPEDEAVRDLIDDLAAGLWDRLHTFEVVLKCETKRLNEALDEMGGTPPDEGRNQVRARCWSVESELKETVCSAETMISSCAKVLPQRAGTLMLRRYGPDPEIDRFCRASFELRAGNSEFMNGKW